MRVIDILNMIAKRQELPREIEYNGDIGILVKENDFTESDKVLKPIIKSIVTKEQFESMEYKIGE